jgi:hypothetical protein
MRRGSRVLATGRGLSAARSDKDRRALWGGGAYSAVQGTVEVRKLERKRGREWERLPHGQDVGRARRARVEVPRRLRRHRLSPALAAPGKVHGGPRKACWPHDGLTQGGLCVIATLPRAPARTNVLAGSQWWRGVIARMPFQGRVGEDHLGVNLKEAVGRFSAFLGGLSAVSQPCRRSLDESLPRSYAVRAVTRLFGVHGAASLLLYHGRAFSQTGVFTVGDKRVGGRGC